MRVTPLVVRRIVEMYSSTFGPGSWPPSPGLAPWATLISSCSADARYSVVTPKRPLATCRIFDRAESVCCASESLASGKLAPRRWDQWVSRVSAVMGVESRRGSSPPSPEFEAPPTRFIAIARVSWVSLERAPRDMPPVTKRRRIADVSTSEEPTVVSAPRRKSTRSRRARGRSLSPLRASTKSRYRASRATGSSSRTAAWRSLATWGELPWISPLSGPRAAMNA
mmetsp:Transcript_5702/g.18590  ORF Transcript_5702/g.18590 Transcript_5702/m.18590 type:complete len:225 (+) Transcript_5702:88-762(+)